MKFSDHATYALDKTGLGGNADHCESGHEEIWDVFDNASDQDKTTILTRDGKPVAAVVPVEVLEFYERATNPAYLITGDGDAAHPVRLAETLLVARARSDRTARLAINGQPFEWATVDGFHVDVSRESATPGVHLTIAAMSVRVEDRP